MGYAVRSERVTSVAIAVVRRRARQGQLSAVVPEACGVVWKVIRSLGVRGGRHVAVYRGAGGGEVEAEVGAEVAAPVGRQGEVFDSATPAGEVAAVTHLGPYQRLGEAHAAIRAWCAANARTPAGPTWEVYGHWLPAWDNDPSQIRTDVYHLLR
jgi:effector-binding domain-containing protein